MIAIAALAGIVLLALLVERSAWWRSRTRILGRHSERAWIRLGHNFGFKLGRVHYCRAHGWRPHL